jgi:hypothetical protein
MPEREADWGTGGIQASDDALRSGEGGRQGSGGLDDCPTPEVSSVR